MRTIFILVAGLLMAGCGAHPNWLLDTVQTGDGEPGEARITMETVWGRTEWVLENGVLYVGENGNVVREIWGAKEGKLVEPVAEEGGVE